MEAEAEGNDLANADTRHRAGPTMDGTTVNKPGWHNVSPAERRDLVIFGCGIVIAALIVGGIFLNQRIADAANGIISDEHAQLLAAQDALANERANRTADNASFKTQLADERANHSADVAALNTQLVDEKASHASDKSLLKDSQIKALNLELAGQWKDTQIKQAVSDRDYWSSQYSQVAGKLQQLQEVPGVSGTARIFGGDYISAGHYGALRANEGVNGSQMYVNTRGQLDLACYKSAPTQTWCSQYQELASVFDPARGGWSWVSMYDGSYYKYVQVMAIGDGGNPSFAVSHQ